MKKNKENIIVGIMGTSVSSGNRGVLALGASLVNLCSETNNQSKPILFLNHHNNKPVIFHANEKSVPVRVVNCRLSPRSRPQEHLAWIVAAAITYRIIPLEILRRTISRVTPWIEALEQTALVGDIRGGDSFSDIYGMKRFLIGFLMEWTVLLIKGNIVQFPQTFGPFKSPIARWLSRYLLKHSSIVIARDKKSQRVAQKLLESDRNVWLSPDVAFSLEAVRPVGIVVDPPLNGPIPAGIIGLNVNGLMYNGGYTRKNMFGLKLDYKGMLPLLVKALLKEFTGELWLIPHTYGPQDSVECDPEACYKVHQSLPKDFQSRVRTIKHEYDQHEIKGLIGQCDFFIGSRMHACIAALSQGVPCVGVAYSMKFKGVFESVGMEDWVVDGTEVTSKQSVEKILELYQGREKVRQKLRRNSNEARIKLKEIFEKLLLNA